MASHFFASVFVSEICTICHIVFQHITGYEFRGFFLYQEVQFRVQNVTTFSHFVIFPWLYPSTRKLSLQVISARKQTKVSITLVAVSLFTLSSVIQALSIAFAYFDVNHNFDIKLFSFSFFMRRVKPRGWGTQSNTIFLYILKFTDLKNCNNRASFFF